MTRQSIHWDGSIGYPPRPRDFAAERTQDETLQGRIRLMKKVTGHPNDNPLQILDALHRLQAILRKDTERVARLAHDNGVSWTDIGYALKISKQAASQRYASSNPTTKNGA